MDKEPFENNPLHEIDFWKDLIKSSDWTYYTAVLRAHKAHLEKQALLHLSHQKFSEASCFNARAQECGILLNMADSRLTELNNQKKEKDNAK